MFCCVAPQVQDDNNIRYDENDNRYGEHDRYGVSEHDNSPDDSIDTRALSSIYDNSYSSKSLVDLPTELLVKILFYLPIHDRVMMRYICKRFEDASEMPLLWKDFVWRYKPHHVRKVINLLKVCGEHVRQIYFPGHVTQTRILEVARYCVKVTHLSLPKATQLTLDHLEEIMYRMSHLEQLDLFACGNFIQQDNPLTPFGKFIERLLKVTTANVKELKLRTLNQEDFMLVIASIKVWAYRGNPLPSVISICSECRFTKTSDLFKLWSESYSQLPSFEINVYDNTNLPTNFSPPVPRRKFKFGPAATPPLIELSYDGIMDLDYDIFHMREYDHHGIVGHAITPVRESDTSRSLMEKKHFNFTSPLDPVSYVDISYLSVTSSHLQRLAVVCPNLQHLDLQGNAKCLKVLQGFRAIVKACENLESLNLERLSVSAIESHVLLWELLSSLKKLTHLNIDLCMVKLYDGCDDASKQKLITMFNDCRSLQSIEIYCRDNCIECKNNTSFLFSYFPSLAQCKMFNFRYSGIAYAITNCHRLKSLSEVTDYDSSISYEEPPLLNNCHLQKLCIRSSFFNLSDELVEVLSAHGELETINLQVNSITFSGISTLIKKSPYLLSLHVIFRKPLFNEDVSRYYRGGDYEERMSKLFSHHKLFDIGNVIIRNVKAL